MLLQAMIGKRSHLHAAGTNLCNGLRAVIIDGAGVAGIAGSLAVMGAWGAISFVIGLRAFRWG